LLADDPLGARREDLTDPLPATYWSAFERISQDPNHVLLVAEAENGSLVGVLQLSFLPYLTYRGGWRAQIEGVRVARSQRGTGLGQLLIEAAVARARAHGCHLVQLTTDKERPDAIRFYERIGFRSSHEGMKLHLDG